MSNTIFVSIANYRDTEIRPTILDLLEKANHPENIRIGVLSQIIAETDQDCLAPALPQVHEIQTDARESLGPCWARHLILTNLRRNETHVLQIDSHMRFVKDWDSRMLEMLSACPGHKNLMSCYPIGYTPPSSLGEPLICYLKAREFNHQGILIQVSSTISYEKRPEKPIAQAFLAAGFLFGPAQAFDEVPYDPHLYFHGEEVSLAARLWTHGWDFYAPNDVLIYHDYTQNRNRVKHWEDHRDWGTLNTKAVERIHYLLTQECPKNPDALIDIEKFQLGQQRSLIDYENFAKVNFRQRQLL